MKEICVRPRQDRLIRSLTPESAEIWATTLRSLPEGAWKFVLNAAHDALPHNANLHLLHKTQTGRCPLCVMNVKTLSMF